MGKEEEAASDAVGGTTSTPEPSRDDHNATLQYIIVYYIIV